MSNQDLLSKVFWLDAKERLIRTFFQVLITTLPAQTVATTLFSGDWAQLKVLAWQALTAAGAACLSLLWSLIKAKKPGTISPASGVVVPGELVGEVVDELVDVTSKEAIEAYLESIQDVEVSEDTLPDEHTTVTEIETQPEPKGI